MGVELTSKRSFNIFRVSFSPRHYIDISDADWAKNIEARNAAVAAGETTDYAVDSGLLQKVLTLFETPIPDEIDVWFTNRR